jgi:hypothetical protein
VGIAHWTGIHTQIPNQRHTVQIANNLYILTRNHTAHKDISGTGLDGYYTCAVSTAKTPFARTPSPRRVVNYLRPRAYVRFWAVKFSSRRLEASHPYSNSDSGLADVTKHIPLPCDVTYTAGRSATSAGVPHRPTTNA